MRSAIFVLQSLCAIFKIYHQDKYLIQRTLCYRKNYSTEICIAGRQDQQGDTQRKEHLDEKK